MSNTDFREFLEKVQREDEALRAAGGAKPTWDGSESPNENVDVDGDHVVVSFTGYINGAPNRSKWGTTRVLSDGRRAFHYITLSDPGVQRHGNGLRIFVVLEGELLGSDHNGTAAMRSSTGQIHFVAGPGGSKGREERRAARDLSRHEQKLEALRERVEFRFKSVERELAGSIVNRETTADGARNAAYELLRISADLDRLRQPGP